MTVILILGRTFPASAGALLMEPLYIDIPQKQAVHVSAATIRAEECSGS